MEQPTFGLESVCRVQEKSPSDSVKSGMGQRVTFVGGNQVCLVSTGDAGHLFEFYVPSRQTIIGFSTLLMEAARLMIYLFNCSGEPEALGKPIG